MLLYYPQETAITMGPTCILSGSQYWTKDTEHMDPWMRGRKNRTQDAAQHEVRCGFWNFHADM